jgi:hypothetical protein
MPMNVTSISLADVMGQAEWIIKNWLTFRAASGYERRLTTIARPDQPPAVL